MSPNRQQIADVDRNGAVASTSEETALLRRPRAAGSAADAIARHKLAVLLAGAALSLAGAIAGVTRKPTYTASSTLQVGTVNLNSPSFYGFVQSASDLATVFSRSITAAPVLARIQSRLKIKRGEAVKRLSAEPLPLSPSFRIIATAPTPEGAVKLANTASHAVIAYNAQSARRLSPPTKRLLAEYRRAAQAAQSSAATVAELTRTYGSRSEAPELIEAKGARDADRIRANALGAAYQNALVTSGANPPNSLLSIVAGAVTAGSDHTSKIELFAFIGLLAGLVLGAIGAVLYEHWKPHVER